MEKLSSLERVHGSLKFRRHLLQTGDGQVGSGMIERAVALVINRRIKKRGMRWCRPNATAVVALRTDLLNDDWITPQRLRAFP